MFKDSAGLSLFILALIFDVFHALRSALLGFFFIIGSRFLVCQLFFFVFGIICFRLSIHLLIFIAGWLAILSFDRHDGLFALLGVHGCVLLTLIDLLFLICLVLLYRLIVLVLVSILLINLAVLFSIVIALLRLCNCLRSIDFLLVLVLVIVVVYNVDRSLVASVISVLFWVLRGSISSFFFLFFLIVGWLACLVLLSLFSLSDSHLDW